MEDLASPETTDIALFHKLCLHLASPEIAFSTVEIAEGLPTIIPRMRISGHRPLSARPQGQKAPASEANRDFRQRNIFTAAYRRTARRFKVD